MHRAVLSRPAGVSEKCKFSGRAQELSQTLRGGTRGLGSNNPQVAQVFSGWGTTTLDIGEGPFTTPDRHRTAPGLVLTPQASSERRGKVQAEKFPEVPNFLWGYDASATRLSWGARSPRASLQSQHTD